MTKKSQIKIENLSRFMVYILGHRPDEFGLVPDKEGFIKLKELLWAINEEEGWRYVGRGHIREVLLSEERTLFEADENLIKAREQRWRLDAETPCYDLPKILFHPIRQRAHPHVMDKGLTPGQGANIILTPEWEMAHRIGLRRDRKPVIMEISVDQARKASADFFAFGDLFLAERIPPGAILGPPVSKELEKTHKKETKEEPPPLPDFQPGTFTLNPARDPDPRRKHKGKGKKQRGWKEEARNMRRKKRR